MAPRAARKPSSPHRKDEEAGKGGQEAQTSQGIVGELALQAIAKGFDQAAAGRDHATTESLSVITSLISAIARHKAHRTLQ